MLALGAAHRAGRVLPHEEVQVSSENASAFARHHKTAHRAEGKRFLRIHELIFVTGGQYRERSIPIAIRICLAGSTLKRLFMGGGDGAHLVLEDEVLTGRTHHGDARHGHCEDQIGTRVVRVVGRVGTTEGISNDHGHARRADVDDRVE